MQGAERPGTGKPCMSFREPWERGYGVCEHMCASTGRLGNEYAVAQGFSGTWRLWDCKKPLSHSAKPQPPLEASAAPSPGLGQNHYAMECANSLAQSHRIPGSINRMGQSHCAPDSAHASATVAFAPLHSEPTPPFILLHHTKRQQHGTKPKHPRNCPSCTCATHEKSLIKS